MSYIKGGWMHYVTEVCEITPREVMPWENKFIMERYIGGVNIDDCVSQMPLKAPPEPVEKKSVFREGSVPAERKPRQKRT